MLRRRDEQPKPGENGIHHCGDLRTIRHPEDKCVFRGFSVDRTPYEVRLFDFSGEGQNLTERVEQDR